VYGMGDPAISVIIPTYNRAKWLARVIDALLVQTFRDYEIIVSDDGSVDGTADTVAAVVQSAPVRLTYVTQQNKGAGAARNLGLKHAKGRLVLFIDDDVLPAPNLVEEHARGHEEHPADTVAIVGPVVNAPELVVSPFMRWFMNEGPGFPHSRERDGTRLDYWNFCTANLSLKRRFMLEKGMFDESFRPFYEDIELGYRLTRHGLQIILNKKATGYHLRGETFDKYCYRSQLAGRSRALFERKWPGATLTRDGSRAKARISPWKIAMTVITPLAPILRPVIAWLDSRRCGVPSFLYALVSGRYSQKGYEEGLARLNAQRQMGRIDQPVCGISREDVVLDAGTGQGGLLRRLLSACQAVYTIDINGDLLERLRPKFAEDNIALIQADVRKMPFKSSCFDRVICTEVLEHLPDAFRAIEELNRVGRVDGTVVVAVPTHFSETLYSRLNRRYDRNRHEHVTILKKNEWISLFQAADFCVVAVRNQNFVPALYWAWRNVFTIRHDPSSGRILEKRFSDMLFWLLTSAANRLTLGGFIRAGNRVFPKSWYFYLEKGAGQCAHQ